MSMISFIFAIGFILLFPKYVLRDLKSDGVTDKFAININQITIAASVGVFAMWACLIGSNTGFIERSMMITVAGLLSMGAWIDRISAWAPDTIIIPFCILVLFLSPYSTGFHPLYIITSGLILFALSIFLWAIQVWTNLRIAPPADLVAISAPFALFGITIETSLVFMGTAICLLGALKSKKIALAFSRPEAVADAVSDTEMADRPAVTFLSVIFPITLVTMIALQVMRLAS